jgi:8-oxo-dGTP pyrophosphatase MutT (NUDIX family)
MRPREIACAIIIDTLGRFLLQQRDDVPGIIHPGKVGVFGGHREGDETFLQCVVREVCEELSYLVPPERFEHVLSHEGVDIDVDGGTVRGEFFVAREVPVEGVVVTEGSLLIVERMDLSSVAHRLAPSAQLAMRAFLEKFPLEADNPIAGS